MDMDKKLIEEGYTEESGGVLGWKLGVLHEPKDSWKGKGSSGRFICICYFC